MQGLVWSEPELAREYDFDVEKIIAKKNIIEGMQLLSLLFTLFV